MVWENGAVLSVINGLGYPDEGAGTNDQGLCMFCEGDELRRPSSTTTTSSAASATATSTAWPGTTFRFVSPDYFRLVPWEGEGLKPVGYGYDSIEALVLAAHRVNAAAGGLKGKQALTARQRVLAEIDERGVLATPANSWINELVTEAARLSIAQNGRSALIEYEPTPKVRLRK